MKDRRSIRLKQKKRKGADVAEKKYPLKTERE